jgi:DNA-binding beta-propeller fold protein YncE
MADDRHGFHDLHLDRFWDGLVRGDQSNAGEGLDPEEAAAVRAFQRLAGAPLPSHARTTDWRAVSDRAGTQLRMEDSMQATTRPLPPTVFGSNGRTDPRRARMPARPMSLGRDRRALRWLAVAAVILLSLGGLALSATTGSWPFGDGRHASIPAPLVSPVPATPTGPVEFLWQTRGAADDPMRRSSRIAVAPDGTIWVPDGDSDRIRIFAPDGTLLDVWGGPGTGEGQFDFGPLLVYGYGTGSIAFDAAGNFYVVDSGNHRIQKFGPDRRFLTAWGTEGRGDGQFIWPSDVAVDAQGRVFVLDGSRYQYEKAPDGTFVQVFDSDGRFLFDWGQGIDSPGPDKLYSAWGIGIDPDGSILLADSELSIIQRFTPDGGYLETLGGADVGDVKLGHVTDVAVDEQGRIYATDWRNHRVTVLDRDGQFVASWGEQGIEAGQLFQPHGLALDGQGNVYVTDDNGRLQAFRILSIPEAVTTPAS